jgi:hypothetical protein
VSLEPAGGIDSDTVFTAPVFSELDSELQESFRAYIAVSVFVSCFDLASALQRHQSGQRGAPTWVLGY